MFTWSKWCRLYGISWLIVYIEWALLNYRVWPDTDAYLEMGNGLLHHGIFGYRLDSGEYVPNAFRMPVFPVFLAILDLLTRHKEFTYLLFSVLQTFVAAVLPCISWYFGNKVSRPVAILAFAITLLHPSFMVMSVSVLTDITFAVAAGLGAALLYEWSSSLTRTRAVGLGLVCGVACLVRPIMKLYPLVMLLWLCAFSGRLSKLRAAHAAVAIVCFALTLSPWITRNAMLYKAFVLETNQGLNLLWSNAHLVTNSEGDSAERIALKGYIRSRTQDPMQFVFFRGAEYFYRNDLAVSRELSQVASEAYRGNPVGVMKTWIANARYMTTNQTHFDVLHDVVQSRSWYKTIAAHLGKPVATIDRVTYHAMLEAKRAVGWAYALVPLPALLILWRTGHGRLALFMLLNVAYFTGLTAFVAGYDRYRLNLEPYYIVGFATVIAFLIKLLTRWRQPQPEFQRV